MNLPALVIVASDHAGFPLKESVKKHLEDQGVEVTDVGAFSTDAVDYPAIIRKGCEVVLEEGVPGIIFGGSGNGEAMAANKLKGIRAAVCWNEESTKLARQHNDANVLSLGARLVQPELAHRLADLFLTTDFEGGRHIARVMDLDTPFSS
jgi:ribose 5-phosphate isomerase B